MGREHEEEEVAVQLSSRPIEEGGQCETQGLVAVEGTHGARVPLSALHQPLALPIGRLASGDLCRSDSPQLCVCAIFFTAVLYMLG